VKSIKNEFQKEVDKWDVAFFGAFNTYRYAETHIYTIISILDDLRQTQVMKFDFGKNIQKAQSIIYKRSVEAFLHNNKYRFQ
jgi:hypothetical protein